jgi:hypothetical protein
MNIETGKSGQAFVFDFVDADGRSWGISARTAVELFSNIAAALEGRDATDDQPAKPEGVLRMRGHESEQTHEVSMQVTLHVPFSESRLRGYAKALVAIEAGTGDFARLTASNRQVYRDEEFTELVAPSLRWLGDRWDYEVDQDGWNASDFKEKVHDLVYEVTGVEA